MPDGEAFGNVQRIALCNKGLNPFLFAGRFFMDTRNMPNFIFVSVAGHHQSLHAPTLSTVNNNENCLAEMMYIGFRQQPLISDYLPRQLASDDNLYQEWLTVHAPKRV